MIRVETEGDVGTITLARPRTRNALTPEMLEGMRREIRELGAKVGAVVLAGEGSAFCAGFDLSLCEGSPDGSAMRDLLRGLDAVVRAMRACPVPVVVAAHKAAIAGACALVAAADFAVADRGARFGYPVVLLGISPAVSVPTLGPAVGRGAARRLTLDPGLIGGEEALGLGLVSDLVEEASDVGPAALALAVALARKPRGGVAATKSWLNEIDGAAEAGDAGLDCSLGLTGGDEERELLRRFWEGRAGG